MSDLTFRSSILPKTSSQILSNCHIFMEYYFMIMGYILKSMWKIKSAYLSHYDINFCYITDCYYVYPWKFNSAQFTHYHPGNDLIVFHSPGSGSALWDAASAVCEKMVLGYGIYWISVYWSMQVGSSVTLAQGAGAAAAPAGVWGSPCWGVGQSPTKKS